MRRFGRLKVAERAQVLPLLFAQLLALDRRRGLQAAAAAFRTLLQYEIEDSQSVRQVAVENPDRGDIITRFEG